MTPHFYDDFVVFIVVLSFACDNAKSVSPN